MLKLRLLLGVAFVSVLVLASLVVARPAAAACDSAPTDKGSVTASGVVPSNGTYYIWSRNRAEQSGNNAYYLKIDNNCSVKVGDTNIPANTWTWVNYYDGNTANRMSVNLTAGTHSFKFYGSDPSVQVDRLVLTADINCTPTGTGDNCTNGNSTPPIVVTTPGTTGPTVNGTVQTGSSNPNTKTTVIIDGKKIASGNGLVNLDTSNLSDGFHDITVQITNPDGTVQTVTKRILVQNNALFWKKAYIWLFKTTGYNKLLTNVIAFVSVGLVLAGIGVGVFIAWSRRIWETLPVIKNIHLPFLHVPGFLARGGGTATSPNNGVQVGDMHGSTSNTHHFSFRLFGHTFSPNIPAIATIAAFAIIGSAALLYGSAAANGFIVEPEAGTRTGVATLSDSSAAGGAYILFGTGAPATCPAGQTGTPPNCVTPPATCPVGTTGTPPNCVTTPPPVTGARPTRANTGPRYALTNMTADQFTSSGVCNRQRINGEVRLDGNDRGRTFTMTDCEITGNLFISTGDASTPLTLAQMVTFNMDYVDILNSIQTNSAVKFNVNHSFIGNQPQFTMVAAWSQVSGPFPATFSNTLFYQPFATCVPDSNEICPQAHSEAIHVLGFGSGMQFYNVGFELEGGPFGFGPGQGGYTGIMNFHAANAVFDGCWFYAGSQVATYTIGYFDGPGNIVRNSAFDDRLGVGDFSGQQKATFINNRSIQTGAPYNNYP